MATAGDPSSAVSDSRPPERALRNSLCYSQTLQHRLRSVMQSRRKRIQSCAACIGSPLKNEDDTGHTREALDHLIDRVAASSFALEGGDEFPPVSGAGIEEFLNLCKIGTLVISRSQKASSS